MQKGTVGITYPQEDMPYTKDGIVPDIIMNPHAIPGRMTIGHLIECTLSKLAAIQGFEGDVTPFSGTNAEEFGEHLIDKCGFSRGGTEIFYNGKTGEQIEAQIFFGPTYYYKLKHMVEDKVHCLSMDTEVLTNDGWKFYNQLTMNDEIATLKDGSLVYEKPIKLLYYPDFEGEMYHIRSKHVNLKVTSNHRMWVSSKKRPYQLMKAEDIYGKHVRYQKNANWNATDYQFILPEFKNDIDINLPEKILNMDVWLTFFGIWFKTGVKNPFGFKFVDIDMQIYDYLSKFCVNETNKFLPDWVWKLSQRQCRILIDAMLFGQHTDNATENVLYYASSSKLADDFMRLCLHAGWSSKILYPIKQKFWLRVIKDTHNNKPSVNHRNSKHEEIYNFKGAVFCLQVPSEVFYVRRNGIPVWTGNSRAYGPNQLLTRQPSEGRSRDGGLRFGEMERDCMLAHGTVGFLKERTFDNSDKFLFYLCKKCGMIAVGNQEKNIFHCTYCDNRTEFSKVHVPYASKLLFQEIMTMGIAPRMFT